MPDTGVLRRPKAHYQGRNGFTEALIEPEADNLPPSDAALNRHRTAIYTLTQKDRPIPTLQQMRAELEIPEQIVGLRDQHLADLQRVHAVHAAEYLNDAMDRYMSNLKDDHPYYTRADRDYATIWEDDIARIRYSHLRLMEHLQRQHQELERQRIQQELIDEEARKRRESQFPFSIAEFRIKPKDVQLRAARFLLLTDPSKQEKMLTDFGWAWRQVQPLHEEWSRNAEFKAEVQALVIEDEIRDPRKRTMAR